MKVLNQNELMSVTGATLEQWICPPINTSEFQMPEPVRVILEILLPVVSPGLPDGNYYLLA